MKLFISLLLISGALHASQPNQSNQPDNHHLKVPAMPPLWMLAASAVPGVNLIIRGTPLATTIASTGVAMVTRAVRNHTEMAAVTACATAKTAYQATQTPPNTARGTNDKAQ